MPSGRLSRARLLLARSGGLAKRVSLLAGVSLCLAGCRLPSFGSFDAPTTQGQKTYHLWQGFMVATLVVGVFVWALIFWAIFAYRKKKSGCDGLPKQTRYNMPWEVTYTIVPLLIVAGLFYFTVVAENQVTQVVANPQTRVTVTGFRWGWRFDYTDASGKVLTSVVPPTVGQGYPQMILPDHEVTRVTLVSRDVVHGFYIPAFDYSEYAQPGLLNKFDLTPTREGTFDGKCAQYCGLRHAQMLFTVRIMNSSDFHTWLSSQEAKVST